MKFKLLISLLLISITSIIAQECKIYDEIILLSKSNITNTVIKAYIDGYTNRFNMTATNILYLKTNNISEDVILYMLNKDKKPMVFINKEVDIEGYDFFRKYYLIPRARNQSNKLLNQK